MDSKKMATYPLAKGETQPQMSDNARYIAETRYAMKNENGEAIENAGDIFWRVAINVARGDSRFKAREDEVENLAREFYRLMAQQKFFPNTPCLVNAGKTHQQLSACFVLPIEDSMVSIMKTMTDMAMIHKSGGGTGFSFSRLRPSGDYIATSGGTTVGPVSFMQAYNDVTGQVKQGGVRRGANMGMLSVDHPDVLRFAVVKLDEYALTNFNISLAITNSFMEKVETDKQFVENDQVPEEVVEEIKEAQRMRDVDARLRQVEEGVKKLYDWAKTNPANGVGEGYGLINPRNGEEVVRLNAYKVFNLITRLAWQYGDPGLVFIDRMNEPSSNPVPKLGRIEATNPCGEQPLLPYDACNLGSINLAKFVGNEGGVLNLGASKDSGLRGSGVLKSGLSGEKQVDWEGLEKAVKLGIHFLDNVVEINEFPVPEIREAATNYRRVGLGVMGFADALYKLGVQYDSEAGEAWAHRFMKFVGEKAREATVELGAQRGVFPAWKDSVYAQTEYKPRNMALTTIAPTGTISMIADTSSGVEPAFGLGYQKNTVEGKVLYIINPVLVDSLKQRGIYSQELVEKIVKNGGKVSGIDQIPEDLAQVFRTALEISPEWHVRIQAAFQKYTDNAVSKTINFTSEATVEDVRKAYLLAYSLGTKGITIYRSGSREKEVIAPVKSAGNQALGNNQMKAGIQTLAVKTKKVTPEAARGVRLRKSCDAGKVYTSVFFEEGDGPVEVFVNLGKSGGYMAGAAEVTGRLASLALKYGADLEEVAKELVGISCGQKVGLGEAATLSMFDAVGKSLLEISRGEQLSMFEEEKSKINLPNAKSELKVSDEALVLDTRVLAEVREKQAEGESKFVGCPDCGSPLYALEGCLKCSNVYCGYSKCS